MHPLVDLLSRRPKNPELDGKLLIGWQEWCSLPAHGLLAVKAKIDTGAKTSAMHAFDIKTFERDGLQYVSFYVHPLPHSNTLTKHCTARLVDERHVMSSNGHQELRYVIHEAISLGDKTWEIDITLSNRDPLRFRMLLGRDALQGHAIIDPHRILYQGYVGEKKLRMIY